VNRSKAPKKGKEERERTLSSTVPTFLSAPTGLRRHRKRKKKEQKGEVAKKTTGGREGEEISFNNLPLIRKGGRTVRNLDLGGEK